MSGPPPTPTRLRLLKGNPGKRAINREEPQPEALLSLDAPEFLDPVARAKWDVVASQLADLGMLTKIDMDLLVLYCESWSDYRTAREGLKKFGPIVTAPKSGYAIQSPFVALVKQANARCHRLLAEMGMTQSSRSRVRVPGGKKTKLETFLARTAKHRRRA